MVSQKVYLTVPLMVDPMESSTADLMEILKVAPTDSKMVSTNLTLLVSCSVSYLL